MNCQVCESNGTRSAAAGQCLHCRSSLCVDHAEALQTARVDWPASCPHSGRGGASAA